MRVGSKLGEHPGAQDRAESRLGQHDFSGRVLAKRRLQLLLEYPELRDATGQHSDVCAHGRAEGFSDQRRLFQLRAAQRDLNLLCADLEVALPPAPA